MSVKSSQYCYGENTFDHRVYNSQNNCTSATCISAERHSEDFFKLLSTF